MKKRLIMKDFSILLIGSKYERHIFEKTGLLNALYQVYRVNIEGEVYLK